LPLRKPINVVSTEKFVLLERAPSPLSAPSARPRWVWWVLLLWLTYSLALLAWHVFNDPLLYGICRTP